LQDQVPNQTLEITNTKESMRVLVSHINTPTDFYINICDKKTADGFHQLDGIQEYYDRLFNSMLRTMVVDYTPQVSNEL